VKHNPATYYVGPGDREACLVDDVPMGTVDDGALHDDLANDTLPAFAFIVPNLCNDTHDCAVPVGDDWLSAWMRALLDSDAYRAGHMAIFVVWDEPTPMPHIAIAPSIRPGTVVDGSTNHYALLRTTQEMLGLDTLLGNAADAPSMREPLGA
jgi:phospholipase C